MGIDVKRKDFEPNIRPSEDAMGVESAGPPQSQAAGNAALQRALIGAKVGQPGFTR